MTIYSAYDEYKAIISSGDTSSPDYHAAREWYEYQLQRENGAGMTWQQAAEFAASMEYPSQPALAKAREA